MNVSKKSSAMTMLATIVMLISMAFFLSSMSGCGKKEQEVSFGTLEDARAQARSNALFNAKAYRAESPRMTDMDIVGHGDSTQSPSCPQGDGWASVSLMRVEGKNIEKYKVKCSTVSPSVGCFLESDFAKKPFATDENICQSTSKVPFPLPKIGG